MKIISIEEVDNVSVGNRLPMNGKNGAQLGLGAMIDVLSGGGGYDGYKVTTEEDIYVVLISNGQNCCENFGYLSSEDDLSQFVGADLIDVVLTDTALNTKTVDDIGGLDCGVFNL